MFSFEICLIPLTLSSSVCHKHSEQLIPTIILFSHKNKVFKQNLNPNVFACLCYVRKCCHLFNIKVVMLNMCLDINTT